MVTNNSGPRTQVRGLWSLYSTNCTVLHTVLLQYTHTHTGLLFCLFLCICVLCHFREAKAVFCVFNPFNGGLESSYTSYMCPTLLHCLPVQRIWSEENDPNDLRLIGYHVQFTEGSGVWGKTVKCRLRQETWLVLSWSMHGHPTCVHHSSYLAGNFSTLLWLEPDLQLASQSDFHGCINQET